MVFDKGPQIIGELPMDDVRLLEQTYQKELRALLERRGVNPKDFLNKYIQLLPGKTNEVFYVCIMPPPPPGGPPAP